MPDHIYDDGRQYDVMFPGSSDDIQFFSTFSRDPVLELACGTGRLAIPLAQAGLNVTGIDIAEGMLNVARQKSSAVEWIHGDIRDFHLGKQFSTIIFINNALCHLLTLADFEAGMRCVREHLLPDGRFIIDVFVPSLSILMRDPDKRFPFDEYHNPDGGKIVVTSSNRYAADTQINHNTLHYRQPSGVETTGALTTRMYYPQELDALLKYNGFAIERKYEDYDRKPFDASAAKQIVICSLLR